MAVPPPGHSSAETFLSLFPGSKSLSWLCRVSQRRWTSEVSLSPASRKALHSTSWTVNKGTFGIWVSCGRSMKQCLPLPGPWIAFCWEPLLPVEIVFKHLYSSQRITEVNRLINSPLCNFILKYRCIPPKRPFSIISKFKRGENKNYTLFIRNSELTQQSSAKPRATGLTGLG